MTKETKNAEVNLQAMTLLCRYMKRDLYVGKRPMFDKRDLKRRSCSASHDYVVPVGGVSGHMKRDMNNRKET